jgi:hypothetical protein
MPEHSWNNAIKIVLSETEGGLHYTEIANRIKDSGLRKVMGATPSATVISIITTSIAKDPKASPYIKVGRGEYMLRESSAAVAAGKTKPKNENDIEEKKSVITSYGVFWRRAAVKWGYSPKLLGMEMLGATPVDFCSQIGIYLLYDGREAIYVGRSTDRPLGRRLYEHTQDRFASRWDRFSWFGIQPVSDEGRLLPSPQSYSADLIIPSMEAVLIEALEPRQNRKRGDDLSGVEYIQNEDPEISRRLLKETLNTALENL